MSRTFTIVYQVVLTLIQLGNLASVYVPDDKKPLVAGILSILQGVQAALAHDFNADGTPASVAYVKAKAPSALKALAVLALLGGLSAVPARAQTYSVEFGAGFYANSTPRVTGHASLLIDVDGTGKNFSYTTLEVRGLANGQPVYSTRTGLARLIKTQGKLSIFALASGGVAASSTATSGAFSGGGAVAVQLTPHLGIVATAQALAAPTAGGWQPVVQTGFVYKP